MRIATAVRGPLMIPRDDGVVEYHKDGLLVGDHDGVLLYAGPAEGFDWPPDSPSPRRAAGVMLPPLLDIHTHVPQHPIRGRFIEGVPDDAPQGKLLAGLHRNVFPAELRCVDESYAIAVVDAFVADTLSHGVVGGASYMTTSPLAARVALERMPDAWSVGLVLMNQNCPPEIHTDDERVDDMLIELADRFGSRVIVTDRFAVAVDSALRRRQSALAARLGLRTQTHLNEQPHEKRFIEEELYPDHDSYTHVYHQDGLLDHRCIVAHCIYMHGHEWQLLAETGSVIAHCPTSNALLGSGRMDLDEVKRRGLPYALATDVGASPTVSMLAEMRRFLQVHDGFSSWATACEALVRSTVAPAALLDLRSRLGELTPGRPMSFIEVEPLRPAAGATAEHAVRSLLPDDPDRPATNVRRVTLRGETVSLRATDDA
ncbi:MAG: amidohydrolase family protein [Planctomycetota bacterium]